MWQIVLSCNCSLYVIGRVIAGEFKQLLKAPYGLSPCRFNLMAIHPPSPVHMFTFVIKVVIGCYVVKG